MLKHDHTQTAVAHDWPDQSSWNKYEHVAKVTTNTPIYINEVLRYQFVHRKISTLTFETDHVCRKRPRNTLRRQNFRAHDSFISHRCITSSKKREASLIRLCQLCGVYYITPFWLISNYIISALTSTSVTPSFSTQLYISPPTDPRYSQHCFSSRGLYLRIVHSNISSRIGAPPCPRGVHHVKLVAVGCGSLLWSEAVVPWILCARYLGPRGEVTACVLCEWPVRSARRDREFLGFRFFVLLCSKADCSWTAAFRDSVLQPWENIDHRRYFSNRFLWNDFKEIHCQLNTYHIKHVSPCTATGFFPSMVPLPIRRVFYKV